MQIRQFQELRGASWKKIQFLEAIFVFVKKAQREIGLRFLVLKHQIPRNDNFLEVSWKKSRSN